MNLSDEFNNWKEKFQEGIKHEKKLISLFLERCDRQLLIEILKKRGIIKRDWMEDKETYKLIEKDDFPSMPLEMHGKGVSEK